MKIPRTFVPEKDYSKKKIYKLVKKYHKLDDIDENITLEDKIIIQAKAVAKSLGKSRDSVYVFTDRKNNLIISYDPSVAFQGIELLTIQCKKGTSKEYLFKSIKWDKSPKEEIRVYAPGDWQVHLDRLYKTAQKK